MRAATVVQQLCKTCRTCFMFYCMFYFTCDRSFSRTLALFSSVIGQSSQCGHSAHLSPIHIADADATQLSSWVASAMCRKFATSWRQSRRVWTNLPTAKSSCVVLALWTHPWAFVTQIYNFLCCWAIEVRNKWRHNDVIDEKVINVYQNLRSQTAMEFNCLVSFQKLSTKSVGSSHELVANSVHTAVYSRHRRCILGISVRSLGHMLRRYSHHTETLRVTV